MPQEFNFLSQLTGSFSQGAAGNPTVAMIEAVYRHHGLDWRYITCEVPPEKLGDDNYVSNTTSVELTGLTPKTSYQITIVALNPSGSRQAINVIFLTTN